MSEIDEVTEQHGGWQGTVCAHPELNGSCLPLPRVSEHRASAKKNQCEPIHGKKLDLHLMEASGDKNVWKSHL